MAKRYQVLTSGISAVMLAEFSDMFSLMAFLGRLSVDSDLSEIFIRRAANGVQEVTEAITYLDMNAREFLVHISE